MTSSILLNHAWNKSYVPTGGAENVFLLLEMKGNGEVKMERAPINVSLVLDRSGSMEGEALEYSKKACHFVIEQMGGNDLLSMVAFDEEIITVFEPQKVTHKAILKQKVDQIFTGGCTNLSGGLIQGAQYVKREMKSGYVNRVILLS
jgi:Ca-activated chloride channel family protein